MIRIQEDGRAAKPLGGWTDAWVRAVPIPSRERRQHVYLEKRTAGLSLGLYVSCGGAKSWRAITYDSRGKAQSFGLGRYPAVRLGEARKKAEAYFEEPRRVTAESTRGTFGEVAEAWFRDEVEGKLRSEREVRRILDRYVLPKWQAESFGKLGRSELKVLLDGIIVHRADGTTRGVAQANAVLAVIRKIGNDFMQIDSFYRNPFAGVRKRSRPLADIEAAGCVDGSGGRSRILFDDKRDDYGDLIAFWNATGELGGVFGSLARVLLLSGQRREKVGGMRWDDLELSRGIWTIPKAPREKGIPSLLRLPKLAVEIIAAQPRIEGNPFVFAGRGYRKDEEGRSVPRCFNSWSERKAELDRLMPNVKPWVLHDLRRTARSLMEVAQVPPHVSERVLGHQLQGVLKIYNRASLTDEMGIALDALAALVLRLVGQRLVKRKASSHAYAKRG